ncbi:hypothetical protein M569_07228, partial [Genlisea aurea]
FRRPMQPTFCFSLLLLSWVVVTWGDDAEALLALKASLDPLGVLPWSQQPQGDFCQWRGVKACLNGRVMKLVVERLNLSGTIDGVSLNRLDQLRVLSFKQNSLHGPIPELSQLHNLKSLFLNENLLSGGIPSTLPLLHRLKVVVLNGNRISGGIPPSFSDSARLRVFYLQDNRLTGGIPNLNQTSLAFFNVSNNALSGRIPATVALTKFNESSFVGNLDLCGQQIRIPCGISPSPSPSETKILPRRRHRRRIKKLVLILVLGIAGFFLLCITALLVILLLLKKSRPKSEGRAHDESSVPSDNRRKGGGFNWEQQGGEGLGNLVFIGAGTTDQLMDYTLEDLLKASAETLGRGTIGSTYKAVMESGYIVTVKRLKDGSYPTMVEFRRHIEILGRLRHPNLVPLRAYFQAKEERLLVYDYFPNGSLFSLLHGSRGAGGVSKPLHWTSCMKIAEDLASGLACIHQNPGLTHGNLKSTNVLLGPDFESCLTDYALNPFRNPDSDEESSASSLFYRAPECRDARKTPTQPADVYGYGVLLLELLTGKTPFQDLVQEHGPDIPKWVRAVREEESSDTAEEQQQPSGSEAAAGGGGDEEKLNALLNAAMACVSLVPSERPLMKDVLRMIREARAEAHLSSNSSDHSPGRWSDTVQSLPREEQHLSI